MDVSTQDWFAQDVASALAAGFVSGYPDGTFRPQEEVSRQEAACMLAKLLKLDGGGSLNFSDAGAIASWAEPSVSGLVAAGIMAGYPDGAFRPQLAISRAEAVVMINKALAFQALTPVSGQLQVTGDVVNVRSGPSTSAQVIGQAYSGDILQAKAKNNDDWYQIDYQGGSGWIAGQYVQDYQPPPAPSSTQATSSPPTNSQTSNSQTSNSPINLPQTSNSTPSNSTVSDSTPGSTPAEPSRGDPASLNCAASRAERRRELGGYSGNTGQHSVCREDRPTSAVKSDSQSKCRYTCTQRIIDTEQWRLLLRHGPGGVSRR